MLQRGASRRHNCFQFVVSRNYASEFLYLCEVVFDHVPSFIYFGAVVALHLAVCFG